MSRRLAAPATVFAHDIHNSSTTQGSRLGAYAETNDGRGFRYAQFAALAVAGSLYQSSAPVAAHLANTPPAVAIGDTSFTYTPGAATGAANLYAEGYLQVDTTPGEGYTYEVSGHGAIASGTAFTLTLVDPIQVALTTGSRVGLRANPYRNVIVAPTVLTAKAVGVASFPVPAASYGWLGVRGTASCLINGTPAVNAPVVNSATTAGALDVWTAGAQPTASLVGYMQQLGVSGKCNFVDLNIS